MKKLTTLWQSNLHTSTIVFLSHTNVAPVLHSNQTTLSNPTQPNPTQVHPSQTLVLVYRNEFCAEMHACVTRLTCYAREDHASSKL